jgi:hypothetical protein
MDGASLADASIGILVEYSDLEAAAVKREKGHTSLGRLPNIVFLVFFSM